MLYPIISGWWFGTFCMFPYIGNNHPKWPVFFRGVQTTNQISIYIPYIIYTYNRDNPSGRFPIGLGNLKSQQSRQATVPRPEPPDSQVGEAAVMSYLFFHKWGTPRWLVYKGKFMEILLNMDDLGVLLFQETSISMFHVIHGWIWVQCIFHGVWKSIINGGSNGEIIYTVWMKKLYHDLMVSHGVSHWNDGSVWGNHPQMAVW